MANKSTYFFKELDSIVNELAIVIYKPRLIKFVGDFFVAFLLSRFYVIGENTDLGKTLALIFV